VGDYSKVFTFVDPTKHIALIAYPTTEAAWPDRFLVYNWIDDTWSFEDPGTEIRCMNIGSVPVSALQWLDLGPWQDLAGSWASLGDLARTNSVFHSTATAFYVRGETYTRDGADYHAYVQRGWVDLDELTQHAETRKMLRSVYLQITGTGVIHVQFGTSDTPYDAAHWDVENTIDLADSTMEKIDVRLEGRYLHWRIGSWTGTPEPGSWSLSGMDLDIQLQGVR
jgi:hypothetical protein